MENGLEIIEVKDQNGMLLKRHTRDLSKYYAALAEFQKEEVSFLASAKNPHFKNNFAQLPDMLTDTNRGFYKVGLVQNYQLAGAYIVITHFHLESGQFLETYTRIPAIESDINKIKGSITSMTRYAVGGMTNMGADADKDNADTTLAEKSVVEQKQSEPKQVEQNQIEQKVENKKTLPKVNSPFKK